MKLIWKILLGIVCLLILFAAYIQLLPSPKQNIAYPDVTLLSDSLSLARGEYLIFGPAHCVGCHSKKEDEEAVNNGEIVALAGGKFFDTPMGNIYIPNITPDSETGIGNLSNGEIARAMRYAVFHTGRAMIPVMPFTHMSEYDVSCIISYLRDQSPVKNKVPETKYTFFGNALSKFLLRPFKETMAIPKKVEVSSSLEYGSYLVNNVANCAGCHTTFNINKMEYDGVRLAGGGEFMEKEHIFRPPNLTPDPKTGHIIHWTEDQFVTRFKSGRVYSDTPMPWTEYMRMSEDDLRSIYRYLKSIEPYENDTSPVVRPREG